MKKWNFADWMLGLAALSFCLALTLKLKYPGVLAIEALFFCSEAALVGGVADWFAVTALFEKPLGFSWHTALLVKRRDQFSDSCVQMIQNEFFSKKKLLARIKKFNLLDLFIDWLEKDSGKQILVNLILEQAERSLDRFDANAAAREIEREIQSRLKKVPQDKICSQIGTWILENHKDAVCLNRILSEAREKITGERGKELICVFLETYSQQQTRNTLSALIAMAAQLSNILNFEEAAEILQKQLLHFIDDLMEEDHPLRLRLLAQMREVAAELADDESWLKVIQLWQNGVSENISLTVQLEKFIKGLCRACKREGPSASAGAIVRQSLAARIVWMEIEWCLMKIKTDKGIRDVLEAYLYDLAGRSVLQAQSMIGVVVREVLESLNDNELNTLISSKIAQDLIWIRINGVIVGAAIGLCVFIALKAVG